MRKTLVLSLLLMLMLSPVLYGQERDTTWMETDKVVLEQLFWEELFAKPITLSRDVPDNLKRIKKQLYVSENGWYETESVQNTSFFRRTSTAWLPVCESALPMESIMTLLTGYSELKHYTVDLEQHRYGYTTVRGQVSLNQLLAYCLNTGCKPYVGVESTEENCITASLFMVNHQQGYCHTFKFEIEQRLLDKDSGIFTATAFTYTPIHNVSQ